MISKVGTAFEVGSHMRLDLGDAEKIAMFIGRKCNGLLQQRPAIRLARWIRYAPNS